MKKILQLTTCMVMGIFLCFLLTAGAAQAALQYNTNLIVNGNAEDGVNGWTTTAGTFTALRYDAGGEPNADTPGPVDRGTSLFSGGENESFSSAEQTIDVSSGATSIDDSLVHYQLNGYLGGWCSQGDNAKVTVSFMSAADNIISSVQIGPVSTADRESITKLLQRSQEGIVPSGTHHLVISIAMTRTEGNYNDGYVDNLSLILTQQAPPDDLCSAATLQDCLDETSCAGVGGYWYDNFCHSDPEGGSGTKNVWDSWVYGADNTTSTTNNGASTSLLGYPISNCNTANAVAYIRFDLTSFPETVSKVNLVVNHLPHTTYCYSNCEADFYFYPVLEPWDEMTITYNNQPALGTEPVYGPIHISFPNDLGQQKYDITNIYRQWKSGTIPNYGLGIYSPTVGCNNAAVMFRVASSENQEIPGPTLEITSDPEDLCSAANLQDCLDESSCTGVGGFWYDNACHNTSASGGLVANCGSAAPQEALPLVDFPTTTVNPTDNPVVVGARSEVTVQPTMQVPSADVGQTASLIMYIYLPDLGFGINIPAKTTTLSTETLCDLLPNPINLSTAAGFSFYVYYGYVIGADIKYTAYSVVVDPACVDDCQSITDKTICNANPNCTYQEFPTAQCVWDCESYKTETACEEAFGNNVCGWNELFSTCSPIQQ